MGGSIYAVVGGGVRYETNEMKVRDHKECVTRTVLFSGTGHTHRLFTFNPGNTQTLSKHSFYPETRSASKMHFLLKCSVHSADKGERDRD